MSIQRFLPLFCALACALPARAADRALARRGYEAARMLYYRADFKEALREANVALESDPRMGQAYELRARVWHVFGDPPRQRVDAQKALDELGNGSLDADGLIARGGALLLLGSPDRAMSAFDAAVSASKRSPESLAARARGWKELGDYPKAVADLDEALKGAPKTALWLYSRARARYEMGEDAKAVADLTAALRANKNFAQAFGLIGAALARKGDHARALKAYARSAALDPEYSFARLGRAAIYQRKGDDAAAFKEYEEALRADPQDYAAHFNRAEMHWRAGRREEALADMRSSLASPKIEPAPAMTIGDRYLSLQLWKEAADAYTRAKTLGAGPYALVRRSKAKESAKDMPGALADLDEALRAQPDVPSVLAARGTLLSKLGEDEKALVDLTRAVRLSPRDTEILVARATFFARTDKPKLAMEDFDAAIKNDPKADAAYNGRGALYANAMDDPARALQDILKAVELKPREPGYHYNLGAMRLRNRLYLRAVESYDQALALKGPAARVLERRAEAKFQLGDQTGALRDVESSIEKDPKAASAYDQLGYMRLRAREPEQAVRDLSQAAQIDPDFVPTYLHRALSYGALGQYKQSAADFDRLLKRDPLSREGWTGLCQLKRLTKSHKDSLKACDQALTVDPQHGPAYMQRALTYLALKMHARALEDLDSAWQLGVRRAEGMIAKAVAHAASRQYKEAHRAYLQAVTMDPYVRSWYLGFAPGHPDGQDFVSAIADLDGQLQKDNADPYTFILRADSLHNAEQFDKAVLEYTKAMELDGTISDAYVGRGAALTAQDALEAAQQDFVRALELSPDDYAARVRLAVVLTMRRNYKAALGELGKAIKTDPRGSEAYLRAANVHYFLKDYPKALENYSLAVKADPLDPNAHNGLGLGYFALKRHNDALENFSRAISLNSFADRYYRNRASVWTSQQKYGNAASDFRTASMVNTDPTLVEEYRRLIDESESRSAKGKSS